MNSRNLKRYIDAAVRREVNKYLDDKPIQKAVSLIVRSLKEIKGAPIISNGARMDIGYSLNNALKKVLRGISNDDRFVYPKGEWLRAVNDLRDAKNMLEFVNINNPTGSDIDNLTRASKYSKEAADIIFSEYNRR